jgi:RNA polymerase sigma-70 factor (ECF subfamily)
MSQGDPAEFRDIARHRELLRTLASLLVNRSLQGIIDPSDLVQETLLKAHKSLQAGAVIENERNWLYGILRYSACDALRDWSRRRDKLDPSLHAALDESSARLEQAIAAESLDPLQEAARNEEAVRLAEALARLPEQERDVVMRHALQEQPMPEVSGETGVPVNVLAGRYARGVQRLRKLMGG